MANPSNQEPQTIRTPVAVYADFCLIPIGTGDTSVSKHVADVQRLLKKSGLNYHMHSAGTTVEGSWEDVTRVIGQAHSMLHAQGISRVHTDIRIGSRTDKQQTMQDKVASVEERLARDEEK
ncbi:DUF77-domain-containing protein [Tuber magnatum]|uniref:DUF77-domain-containing protein n=1 Tax=Tuber magnatum TaxID=42249 RepID=A0A317SUE6_9PEZI|nr:DUF77-domain-containing protein [Tuber magnatum]